MTNFSYIWIFVLFLLQVVSIGMNIAKLGEEKKRTYKLSDVFFAIFFSILTGLSLYWMPQSKE